MIDEPDDIPPRGLEDRIVAALAGEGLVRRRAPLHASPVFRGLAAASVAALLVFGGWSLGQPVPLPDQPVFALMLYEGPQSAILDRSPDGGAAEYGRWARDHSGGAVRVISGEKLGEPVGALGAAKTDGALQGFFLISAPSRADALALARTCPHLRRGGAIEVREVERSRRSRTGL